MRRRVTDCVLILGLLPAPARGLDAAVSRMFAVGRNQALELPHETGPPRMLLGRVDESMKFWTIVLRRWSFREQSWPYACSSVMLCGRKSNPCSGNSSTPPAARRGSATGCSSKLSCTRPAPGPLGGTCPTSSATGMPSIIAFAVGKRAAYGSGSGSGSRPSTMNNSTNSSSIRPLCVHISTPPERQKKRWATSPGSGPLSGWTVHQVARGLH